MKQLSRLVMFTVSIACAAVSARAGVDRFTSISPEGADISAIVIDPLKPSTLYAGSFSAGVFKSVDRGESWRLVFDLETLRDHPASSRQITRLVIDPARSSTVYASISVYQPSQSPGSEIVKTEDGGTTWSLLRSWLEPPLVDLIIDPSSPNTLYALTATSLMQSVDGGLSWSSKSAGLQAVFAREFLSVAVDPSLPSRLYVSSARGLYVSNDRGGVWQLLLVGNDFRTIVVDPADSATLYGAAQGLIVSKDGGKTWTTVLRTGLIHFLLDPLTSAAYAVVANPSTDGKGNIILATTDRGQTWTPCRWRKCLRH